ncbi:Fibroblast growth factor receptor [Dissostichus eleginoides]|uniref:Fibroblast growth factor receptor n=1 Tax=Dissostichus eleginoides TaxID=100907 RepID=A0AAD9FKL0_DISEL|nr:Fibroblast growth factor receptor [Dissostichus eleginoides]
MSRSTAEPSPTLSFKKRRLHFKPTVQDTDYDADSSASTEITDLSENTPTDLDSDDGTEEDRTEKVIEAYPCFREHKHVLDEMGRILEAGNKNFTDQIKARWESFCENALFFGVWNKSLKPPMGLDKCKHNANIDNTDVL